MKAKSGRESGAVRGLALRPGKVSEPVQHPRRVGIPTGYAVQCHCERLPFLSHLSLVTRAVQCRGAQLQKVSGHALRCASPKRMPPCTQQCSSQEKCHAWCFAGVSYQFGFSAWTFQKLLIASMDLLCGRLAEFPII